IHIHIINFIILIIYLIIYKKQIDELYIKIKQKNEKKEQEYYKKKIDRFKIKFSDLTDQEIENKINQDLVPEAKKALIEIKSEREKTHYNNAPMKSTNPVLQK